MHHLHPLAVTYLTELRNQRAQSNSTDELSYRDFLGKFLRGAAEALGKTASFTGEAKKITFGRPDYEVTHGLKVIGYVEAEALGTPLAQLKGSAKEQNERFRANLHNFLLTNHLEFRLYLGQSLVASALLPEPPESGKIVVSDAALDALQSLLETFLDATTPAAATAEAIARQLARRARFLRVAADAMLSHDDSPLHTLWNLYKVTLFDGITAEKFADVYAQTFTYGLFLAWLNTDKTPFDRDSALSAIPDAVPPIQVLMEFGGGRRLPEAFHWIVDGICSDLEAANKEAATQHPAGIADPLISFYETFLSAYDPQLRERAGVYYTPDPVVDFIVRAVDDLLRRDFAKPEGLADPSVRLLDPATGTATFLARAYRQVHQTMQDSGDAGVWPDRARDHLAKHFYGFERLPAAYTLAHVKLRQQLAELGVTLGNEERLPVYLADTMMNRVPDQMHLPGADVLSKEVRAASQVRDQEQILVVMGNPPYFGKSDNPSKDGAGKPTFIGDLIQTYFQVDGVPLGEKNPKWLQNDYVKFIRFAQWRIERSGHGIVAFITDNSYLDNPTFRGMRRSLMKTFDEIYILDLHGNSKKKERNPNGGKDENVFDITQGVAIALFIRREGGSGQRKAVVRHEDIYETRLHKYQTLLGSDIESVEWQKLAPDAPAYLLIPQEQAYRAEYEGGWSINEILTVNTIGIVTGQDTKVLGYSQETAEQLAKDANLSTATVVPIFYKPFDRREGVYSSTLITRPRANVMRHLLAGKNLALVFTRSSSPGQAYDHIFTTRHGMLGRFFVDAACITYFAPLWLYPEKNSLESDVEREANLAPKFVTEIKDRIGETPTPEDIFHYAYAVFHAPTYRTRYAAFLKTDFPRLPLPPDSETFHALAALGKKLVALHLLEDPGLQQHGIGFPKAGSHQVKKMRAAERYVPPKEPTPARLGSPPLPVREGLLTGNEGDSSSAPPSLTGKGSGGLGSSGEVGSVGRVRLNDEEYFDNVPPEAWEFRVGGYQPAAKWLDDRAGRTLTADDITHYRRMIAAMRETSALLPQVDAAFLRLLTANPAAEGQSGDE